MDRASVGIRLLGCTILLGFVPDNLAIASVFDGCVLDHMQGVQSDLAAVMVKRACIRTVEVPVSAAELIIAVGNKATNDEIERYVVRKFIPIPAANVVVMGLPPDPTEWEIIRQGVSSFYMHINQTVWEPSNSWDIISAKGFPD